MEDGMDKRMRDPEELAKLPLACLECYQLYKPRNGRQKYCSQSCKNNANTRAQRARWASLRGVGELQRCPAPGCELVFLKTMAARKYCCVACRNRATYWRNKETRG